MGKVESEIYQALRKIQEKDYSAAESLLTQGLKKAEEGEDDSQQALVYSTLGVLSKVKGDYKEAWRNYEKAEKLLPQDPSLKIIMAKLLMGEFAQYDTAIKKLKEVLKMAKGSPFYEHQAYANMAIAYLRKGEKKKAIQMFDLSMRDDFENLVTAENINLEVLEAFFARNLEAERCRCYVEQALQFAKTQKEEKSIKFLTQLLGNLSSQISL